MNAWVIANHIGLRLLLSLWALYFLLLADPLLPTVLSLSNDENKKVVLTIPLENVYHELFLGK